MEKQQRTYIAIDLKSFYASVECVQRGLDPLTTNLVVADAGRTEKTICLAVSPSLKAYGIPGRARLFEVVSRVREVNAARKAAAPNREFTGKSCSAIDLAADPGYELDYIVAVPRMATYMSVSASIYQIYLKYVAPEDMHVYSVDEVFIDATDYLKLYHISAHEFAMKMVRDVLSTTGITATAGIGTNLYLCKIAMDIVAKHIPADKDGVRIAELDEMSYRKLLWNHRPLTDFWRIGPGISRRLQANGLYTMGDVARCSLGGPEDYYNEELLYKIFGINAELIIDHAWGYEPCTIADIKAYRPENNSISSGQVLSHPYEFDKARLVIREMTDLLVLDLVDKGLVTDQMVINVGYDVENLNDPIRKRDYDGPVEKDHYGRPVPKAAHGSINLPGRTSSTKVIMEAVSELFDRVVNPNLLVRRMNVAANHVISEERSEQMKKEEFFQPDLFTDFEGLEERLQREEEERKKEKKVQKTLLDIKKKYGKNAVLRGMNLEEGGTAVERNGQVGGHKA